MQGSILRVTKGDTRSLNYRSFGGRGRHRVVEKNSRCGEGGRRYFHQGTKFSKRVYALGFRL